MRVVLLILLLLLASAAQANQVVGAAVVMVGLFTDNVWLVRVGYLIIIGSAVYGSEQARKKANAQREQERKAYNDSLRDRTVTRVSTDAPFRYILGEARVGSDIVAMFTSGDRDQYRWLVCVHASHECDSVREYYVAGKALGPLTVAPDEPGWVTSGDYYSTTQSPVLETFTGTSFTLAHTPVAGTVRVFINTANLSAKPEAYTLSGTTIIMNNPASRNYKVRYDWIEPQPKVRVLTHLGGAADPVDPVLAALFSAQWAASAVLRGHCYSVVMLNLDQPEFQSGLVGVEAKIRGMKLHDPRDPAYPNDTPVWSENPALAALWYLKSDLCEVDATDIPLADYITAANACAPITGCTYSQSGWTVTVTKAAHGRVVGEMVDMQFLTGTALDGDFEVLTVPDANTFTYTANIWNGTMYVADSRTTSGNCTIGGLFTVNGTISADQDPNKVLDQLAQAMGGGIVRTTWGCWAGVYTAPVMALTQDDIVGSFSTVGGTPEKDLYNGVRGQYIAPQNNYVVTDFTPYQNAAYVTADGSEKWNNLEFPFTDSVYRVHQLCRIALEDQRNGFTLNGVFSLRAFKLRIGQRVTFDSAFIGRAAKVYRLTDREFGMENGLKLTFKEDGPATYDKADATSPEVTPNTSLPNPWTISPPTAFAATQIPDLPERAILTWVAAANVYALQYQVEQLGPNDATWVKLAPVSGERMFVDGLLPGVYQFRIKTINPVLNVASSYTTIELSMEILPVPNVSGLEIFGRGNSLVFGGKHCRLTWRKSSYGQSYNLGSEPYGGNSGGLDYFFKDYVVKVYSAAGTLLRTESVLDENYIYTYEHNAEDHGGAAAREFTIKIWQRGKYGQLSVKPASLSVSNPVSALPAVIVLEGTDTVTLAYPRPTDLDWAGIKIWMSTTSGFTPADANLVYDGIDTAATINGIVPNTTYYYKYAVRDEFGAGTTSAQGSFATSLSNQSRVNADSIAALALRPYGANGDNGAGSPGGCGVLLSSVLLELPKNPQALKLSAVAASVRARLSGTSGVTLYYQVAAMAISNLRQLTGTISINAAGTITGSGTAFLTEMGAYLLLGSSSGAGSFADLVSGGMSPLKLNAPSSNTAGSLNTGTGYYTDGAFNCSGVTAWTFNRVTGSPVVDLGYEEVVGYSTDIGRPSAGFVAELTAADVSNLVSNGATHIFVFSTFRDATAALGASEFTSAQNNLVVSMELI